MLTMTAQLDRIENNLPTIPARVVHLQRTVAGAAYDQIIEAMETMLAATRTVVNTARVSGRTVTGQTRAAGSDVITTAKRNVKQVAGQTKAQSRRVATTAQREVTGVIDAAIDAVDPTPGAGTPYEQWTKAELLERANQLKLEGRYTMNKQQLITALRAS